MSSTYTARSPGRKRRLPPHPCRLHWCGVNSQRLTVVTSCTPSDHRAIHKADIRRILRGAPR
jgi:hypothetical protein